MEFNLGLVFLKKKNFVLGFGVCFKMEFDLGLRFLKKIFSFWVLGSSTNVQKWVCACGAFFLGFFVLFIYFRHCWWVSLF